MPDTVSGDPLAHHGARPRPRYETRVLLAASAARTWPQISAPCSEPSRDTGSRLSALPGGLLRSIGCFWHRHPGCPRTTDPATRRRVLADPSSGPTWSVTGAHGKNCWKVVGEWRLSGNARCVQSSQTLPLARLPLAPWARARIRDRPRPALTDSDSRLRRDAPPLVKPCMGTAHPASLGVWYERGGNRCPTTLVSGVPVTT